MKRVIIVCGLIGLVGCFLPFVSPGDGPAYSWWDLRDDCPLAVYGAIAAFGVASFIGLEGRAMTRIHAAMATCAFGFVFYAFWQVLHAGSIPIPRAGAILMHAGAIGGFASSLITLLGTSR